MPDQNPAQIMRAAATVARNRADVVHSAVADELELEAGIIDRLGSAYDPGYYAPLLRVARTYLSAEQGAEPGGDGG